MITQIAQVPILVKDLEEAKQFYTEALGFVVREEIEFSPGWKYLTVSPTETSETQLELMKAETPEQERMIGRQLVGRAALMFLSADIETDYQEMKAKGVVFHSEPKSVPGGKGAGFEDLYGNAFDLYQLDIKEE
ncbi:hypothetical protein J14TS2_47200 [Bacillus sp. J14TS2]|uniref:VOC family protein n=1 Tax=Bacillus sp. J14TS2 TaxID=2807188 RepID=UPI001B18FC6C|nr:VOC family protein [Bacillus sp. J14TS2]GIN74245.1 hypothetical protein J14TS2_47200 [Bacillus sp. J14TS2]